MTQIQIYDNKILIIDNKIAIHPDCCDVCDPEPDPEYPPADYTCCTGTPPDAWIITVSNMTPNIVFGDPPNKSAYLNSVKATIEDVPFICTFRALCPGASSTQFSWFRSPIVTVPVAYQGTIYDYFAVVSFCFNSAGTFIASGSFYERPTTTLDPVNCSLANVKQYLEQPLATVNLGSVITSPHNCNITSASAVQLVNSFFWQTGLRVDLTPA